MQSDQRKAPRKPLRHSAWLTIDGEHRLTCTLSDISDIGARITVNDVDRIPEEFVLFLAANNAPRRFCKVVWRSGGEIGVQFDHRLAKRPPATRTKRTRRLMKAPPLVPEDRAEQPSSDTPD